jgi:hypothetical protein
MRKRLFSVLVILMLIVSPSTFSQTERNDPPLGAQARQSLARQMVSWFIALDNQIPNLAPSQEQWLQVEYYDVLAAEGNRFTARSMAARDSVEFQVHVVKPRNLEFVRALTRIAGGAGIDRNQEVALWASVSEWLINYQYWQSVNDLVKRGLVQKKIGHVESLYFENYTLEARNILVRIVVPHLEGRLAS